jgi:hypothetical protein
MSNPFQQFVEVAKRDGMVASSTDDGYLLMFTRQRLQGILLGTLQSSVGIGINTEGTIKTIYLDRGKLQNELDLHPDEPMLLIVYTHKPLQN